MNVFSRFAFRTVFPTVILVLGATSAQSANSPAPSTPSTPTSSAYTDRPVSTTTSDSYFNYNPGPFYSGSSSFYSGSYSSFRTVYYPSRIFFPANPPALGQSLPTGATASLNTPANLGAYVSETFFPALSSLLYDEELSRRRQDRIDAYRAAKQSLVSELRTKLEELKGADASRREQELAALARNQSARVLELENTAEAIREDLVNGGFFTRGVDWNDSRQWRLGDNLRYESYLDELKVVRSSAFFQDGLSPQQRRLLRELTMELASVGPDPTSNISLDRPSPYFFFSPDTARIHLPFNLSPQLSRKIDDYRDKKDALKKELRDTLYKQDRAWFDFKRVNALRQLAQQQAPLFAELDILAEEIRRELHALPYPDEPKKSALPRELGERITAYLQKKVDLQRTLTAKRDEVRAALPLDRVEYIPRGNAHTLEVVAPRHSSKAVQEKREAIRTSLASFNAEQRERFATLAGEMAYLRSEVLKLSESSQGGKSVDQLLHEFARSFAQQENWNRYREYRTAVLEPGLSPEQRRLLYDATLEDLQRTLPYATLSI